MVSLYEQLMAAKGAPSVEAPANSTRIREAPMNLRSAMRQYAGGGNVSSVFEDTGTNDIDTMPDYSRAYSALGGADAVNSMRDQFTKMGLDEDTIGSVFSKYYTPEQTIQPVQPTGSAFQFSSTMEDGSDRQASVMGNAAVPPPPSNVLSGNILAGASWNSINPTLASQITELTGTPTSDYSVGASTSGDTLKQLNDFTDAGGSFAPGSTVFLQAGGADFLKGISRENTESNLDQIISTLEGQGVKVVLTGSPNASSYEQVIANDFDPALDPIYGNVAGRHKNVALVDSMGRILQDKSLLADPIHPNAKGWDIYNQSVLDALKSLLKG